jgi:hypothetical protein
MSKHCLKKRHHTLDFGAPVARIPSSYPRYENIKSNTLHASSPLKQQGETKKTENP